MCQGILGTVIQEDPHIDHVFNFKRPKGWLHRQAYQDILLPLKNGHFDLGILMTNSFSSAYWFWRGHVQNRIGYATHGRRVLLDHPISFPTQRKSQHLVTTYKMLLEPLGIPVSQTPPRLYITKQEQQAAREKLTSYGIQPSDILIGINPGAAYGSAKCWLPERFKQLSQHLLDYANLRILFFGDKAGAPLVQEICASLPSNRVTDLAGKTTLRELIACIQACHLFLTNDSGPMHVASALEIPLIALFGSTSDVTTGPYSGGHVIHKHVPCSPCYRRECPIDFRCMTRIEVQEVYEEIQKLLQKIAFSP
jgi:heptosyltransferase-2